MSKVSNTQAPHLAYLKGLIGARASLNKWTELTGKALRSNGYQWHASSPLRSSERILVRELRIGDLVYFHQRPRAPQHAVISKVIRNGRYHAVTTVNGKITEIRVDLRAPNRRRIKGRIVNSFVRTKAQGDKQIGYLAGELVREARRPIRTN